MSGIFRAYDIRGKYPNELNEKITFKIGAAFGTLNLGKIVVGSDTRLSSPSLKKELIRGLISTGATVIDIGLSTTPMLIFSIKHLECCAGINITGSHLPKDFNGFKFYDKNAIAISYESGINKIESLCKSEKPMKGKGTVVAKDVVEDYTKFLLKNIKIKKLTKLKIVVDGSNSPPGAINTKVLKKVGADVYELYCEPDGNFPNHEPDPSKEEALVGLKKKVVEIGADLGFAYDGDGDRLVVIDEKGNTIYVGVIFSMLIKDALSRNPKAKVVYTPIDTKAIEETIKKYNGILVLCRVGHTYISQKMIEEKAVVAGEISGHYFFRETSGEDDALFASLKIIEIITNDNKKISEYAKEFPKYFSEVSEKLRFPIRESEKFSFVEKLKDDFKNKGYKIDTLDGVKVIFEDGWALFRPANTESKISIAYEGTTKKSFERIKKIVGDIIKKIPK